ncbi:MAG: hypothetical protein RL418_343 [Actinomycetota bacterium]
MDPDHLDHFGSLDAFEGEFAKFADAAATLVAISSDDPGAVRVTERLKHHNVITFGVAESASVRVTEADASGPKVKFNLEYRGASVPITLSIPGHHNALNAAGAVAVLVGLGFDFVESATAVSHFSGTERRFQLHGERRGVRVYDDFAHHPTEVEAALKAARAVVGGGKLITVFQPHLYSRTRIFQAEFAQVLELSDEVVCLDIYAAREDPEPGVTGALIADRFSVPERMHYVPVWDDVPKVAAGLAESGDFIITMGCGDIFRMVPDLLKATKAHHQERKRPKAQAIGLCNSWTHSWNRWSDRAS